MPCAHSIQPGTTASAHPVQLDFSMVEIAHAFIALLGVSTISLIVIVLLSNR